MSKGNLEKYSTVKVGDLVTYRSIQELTKENYQQKIIIHGVGIIVLLDDEYSKVYWIRAKQFLWVMTNKLKTFDNLSSRY